MKKVAFAAIISLFAGYHSAQSQQMKAGNPVAQATIWKGTLVEFGCGSAQSEGHRTRNPTSYSAVTSFALVTGDGKCLPFDENSNQKISGLLKIEKDWSENIVKMKPTKVEVMGTQKGGTLSVEEIEIK